MLLGSSWDGLSPPAMLVLLSFVPVSLTDFLPFPRHPALLPPTPAPWHQQGCAAA